MKQKLQTLLQHLNHGLVEREETLKTALLTVLAERMKPRRRGGWPPSP